jgi:hypothetical protein
MEPPAAVKDVAPHRNPKIAICQYDWRIFVCRIDAEGRDVVEVSTVRSRLSRAMAKIGARDRLQAVVRAYRSGLVPLHT